MRGRLWRASNPQLKETERQMLVDQLMEARREVGQARRAGAPDYNRHLVKNTPYRDSALIAD